MDKAPDAYRTISEVGEDLDIAQHVLRFWETRFPQIKPLKRGGGRRYYRPDDVELLKGIRHLLYREGYTIKGVQRILKEQGAKAVQAVGREGGLVPGLAPASPDDGYEDFAPAPPVYRPQEVAASAPPPAITPSQFSLLEPASYEPPPPEPQPHAAMAARMEEGQVSFTRGGLGSSNAGNGGLVSGGLAHRPSFAPVDETAMPETRASTALPASGIAARQALIDALNELESARAAIGRVLANRDRLSGD